MNKKEWRQSKFILSTNNENNICEEVTYERSKKGNEGVRNKKDEWIRLGANLSYYKTDFVKIENLHKVPDEAKIRITYQAGEMIAVREDTLNQRLRKTTGGKSLRAMDG